MSQQQIQDAFVKVDKALPALKQMIDKPMQDDRSNVDAAIQRFEFTIELFWKLLQRILASKGVEVHYPKDVLKESYKGHLVDDEPIWLNMVKDRNMTSHTYDEDLADKIYSHLKTYYPVFKKTLDKLHQEYGNS